MLNWLVGRHRLPAVMMFSWLSAGPPAVSLAAAPAKDAISGDGAPQAARAEPGRSAWDRFSLTVAGFRPDLTTRLRYDSSTGTPGSDVDFERDLGLEDSTDIWKANASWRVSRRFALDASYLDIGRSANATLTRSIDFGDVSYPAGIGAVTRLDTEIATFSGRYALVHSNRLDISLSVGVHWIRVDAEVQAPDFNLAESAKAHAPLPMAGAGLAWNLTHRLQFAARGEYLSVEIGQYDGAAGSAGADLQYRLWDHFGIGVGYEFFTLDIESSDADLPGYVKYDFDGPKGFFSLRF